MHASTSQAYKDAEFRGRPLRGRRAAVAASVVGRGLLDLEELGVYSVSNGIDLGYVIGMGVVDGGEDLRSRFGINLPHGFAGHAGLFCSWLYATLYAKGSCYEFL